MPQLMDIEEFSKSSHDTRFEELSANLNVNDYIQKELICMQLCPTNTSTPEETRKLCEFIRKNFSRVPTVHLLEMLNEVRAHDYAKANEAVQLFFDWIVIHGSEKCTPSVLDNLDREQRVLKYALILRARLAQKFGHMSRAHRYITEAIQKAQANDDHVCLRLALAIQAEIELKSLELAASANADVFDQQNRFSYESCFNRLSILVSMQDAVPSARTSSEARPNQEFVVQCQVAMNLIKAIFLIIKCENIPKINDYLRRCLSIDLGVDRSHAERTLQDVVRAIQSTLQLSLEFCPQSNIVLSHAVETKIFGTTVELNTESHAIKAVNTAYSLAYDGKFIEALNIIDELKKRFPVESFSSGSKHWRLAETCIRFDRTFHLGQFDEASRILDENESHYEMEIRRAILYGVTGNLKKMQEIMENMSEDMNSLSVVVKIRTSLVLAQSYVYSKAFDLGIETLTASLETAKLHHLNNLIPIILRRLIYAQMLYGRSEEARSSMEQLEEICIAKAPRLERGLIFAVKFEYYSKSCEDKKKNLHNVKAVRNLMLAISTYKDSQFPIIEKKLYKEAACFMHINENQKLRNRLSEAYHRLNHQYVKNFDIHLI